MAASVRGHVMNLFFTILLTQATIILSFESSSSGSGDDVVCIESEKQALLSFKHDLVDPSNRLSSWDIASQDNCCKWAGIVCNNLTGHVKELHLANNIEADDVDGALKGNINPSLLSLKHLSYLDLSNNDFGGVQIPRLMGSFGSLTYLNLTSAGFMGLVPHQLGNVSSLTYLGLGGGDILYAENLGWLSGLSSLQHLDMSHVDLSQASNHWLQVINKLSSLSELHLSGCELSPVIPNNYHVFDNNFSSLSILDLSSNYFDSTFLSKWLFNLKSLAYLDLHGNPLKGQIPCGIKNLTALRYLDLSSCNSNSAINIPICLYDLAKLEYLDLSLNNLEGVMSNGIENMSSIVHLDLSYNSIEGNLPASLGNLCHLKHINLGSNLFNGSIPFDSLSLGCLSSSLMWLDLSVNSFSGYLMDQIVEFKNLVSLYLSYNTLSGPIPESVGKLSALQVLSAGDNRFNGSLPQSLGGLSNLELLSIGGNQLSGSLPESLGSLSNLKSLYIDSNLFEGVVSEVQFANLTNLKELRASMNNLSLEVSPNWIPPFHLESIELRSWKLGPRFPMWLKRQHSLQLMDLSSTQIADTIPNWFWNLSLGFLYLNISYNQISGTVPDILLNGSTVEVYLRSNMFSGSLPRISSSVAVLDLTSNSFSGDISRILCHPLGTPNVLNILLLEQNLLSGKVPDCWMYWPELAVITLGNNTLTGEIPNSMGSLLGLTSLHLRNSSLHGRIPSSLQNCSGLIVLDLGLNEFSGGIPKWMGTTLSNLTALSLRSNKLNGDIPFELCRLAMLQILDLADNNLSGTIPKCFNNFKAMATLQESQIPVFYSSFGDDSFLESAFVVTKGRQMQYDTVLKIAIGLDLSANNLTGKIPPQITDLKRLRSLNLSGNHLKGRIPNSIGNMEWLESLDLSTNQLSGQIALSLSSLTYLGYLNLSYNSLSGKIPTGTQLQSFDASSFIGNELCGPPLSKICDGDRTVPATAHGGEEAHDRDEVDHWFRMGIATGFAVSFFGIIAPLVLSTTWRHAYFGFFSYQWYKFLYKYDCL